MPPETCDAKRGDVNIAYQVVGDRGERELKSRAAGACTRSSRSDRRQAPFPGGPDGKAWQPLVSV